MVWVLAVWLLCGCAGSPRHVDEGAADTQDDEEQDPQAERRLVVVTLNTHSFQEGPDSLQKLETIGVELARLGADVVGLNELMSGRFYAYDMGGVEHDAAELIRQAAQRESGEAWQLATFPWAHWDSGELMSNAILCRGEILESDARALSTTDFWPAPHESRGVGFSRVSFEGMAPVNVFVTHAWGWESVDTLQQIQEVKTLMVEKRLAKSSLEVLLGDLNMPSSWPRFRQWLEPPPLSLLDTFALAHPEAPHQSSQVDGEHRIDHVLMREGACRVEQAFFAFDGRSIEGRVSPVVSDHKGVVVHLRCPTP